MTDTQIYEKLAECFDVVFDEYEGEITPQLTADDVAQWDSLSNVQFLVMVEQAFGFRFRTDEITSLKNVGELVDLIRQRTGE